MLLSIIDMFGFGFEFWFGFMFILKFGLTFRLRHRCVIMSNLCPVQVHLNVRLVLKFEFMRMSKFVLVSGLCLRFFPVLVLIRVYIKFRFIFFSDLH